MSGAAYRVTLLLKVREVEQSVFLDGSARAGPELLQRYRRLRSRRWTARRVEVVTRIEDITATVRVGSTVHTVGTRLEADVDHPSGPPTVLGSGIHFRPELINGIDG